MYGVSCVALPCAMYVLLNIFAPDLSGVISLAWSGHLVFRQWITTLLSLPPNGGCMEVDT